MGLLDAFDTETLVMLVFMLIMLYGYSTGNSPADSPWIVAFGVLGSIPGIILDNLLRIFPLGAPLFGIGALALIGLMKQEFGEGVVVLALFSAIILTIA